jgi:hypothetical protein
MMPTDDALQVFYGTVPLIAAILLANWNNYKRLDDVNRRVDDGKASLSVQMTAGFASINTSLGEVETRLSYLVRGTHLVRG